MLDVGRNFELLILAGMLSAKLNYCVSDRPALTWLTGLDFYYNGYNYF